jgi:lysophospholipase L1-like esterase
MRQSQSSSRPTFRILVFGDSVLWGQGLHDPDKIHSLVADDIQRHAPQINISREMYAHSGAILGEADDDDFTPPAHGEVPIPNPTVFQQTRKALGRRKRDLTADVVLLGGGINDVHLQYLLNPLDNSLPERMETVFYRRWKALIELTAYRFPNAKIIATGYYSFFSDSSEKALIKDALSAFGFSMGGLRGILGDLLLDALPTDEFKERSQLFCASSRDLIVQIIHELTTVAPDLSARLFFADPAFGDDNAMFAPETYLFGVNHDLTPQDPLAQERADLCAQYLDRLDPMQEVACPNASVGHPNTAGARCYADAILRQIRYALPKLFVN